MAQATLAQDLPGPQGALSVDTFIHLAFDAMLSSIMPTDLSRSLDSSADKKDGRKQHEGNQIASLGQLPTIDTLNSLPTIEKLDPELDEESDGEESVGTAEETRSEPDEECNAELSEAVPENPQVDTAQASWLDGICFRETKYTLEQEAIMKKLLDETAVRMAKIREKAKAELSKAAPRKSTGR